MPQEPLTCPKDGRQMDMKFVSKWSDNLYLVFCHCGKVHELAPVKREAAQSAE